MGFNYKIKHDKTRLGIGLHDYTLTLYLLYYPQYHSDS